MPRTQHAAAPVRCGCPLRRTRLGAHWRHLVNATEPSLCSRDVGLRQITLTTCFYKYSVFCHNGLCSFWVTICKTVRPILSDRCLSVCLSVTLVYCGQTFGWIKMKLGSSHRGTPPRPWPHCVRWGPSSPSPKEHSPQFSAHVYCGQTVAHLSCCWALVTYATMKIVCNVM